MISVPNANTARIFNMKEGCIHNSVSIVFPTSSLKNDIATMARTNANRAPKKLINMASVKNGLIKGELVARGVERVLGFGFPVFEKRRFQHGATSETVFSTRLGADEEREPDGRNVSDAWCLLAWRPLGVSWKGSVEREPAARVVVDRRRIILQDAENDRTARRGRSATGPRNVVFSVG